MQIVIVGSGGVGSVYGSKLSTRHDVTLVARPDFAKAVTEHGLRVEGKHAGTFPVKATANMAITSKPSISSIKLSGGIQAISRPGSIAP